MTVIPFEVFSAVVIIVGLYHLYELLAHGTTASKLSEKEEEE